MIKVEEQSLRALLIDGELKHILLKLNRYETISEELMEEFIDKAHFMVLTNMCRKVRPSEKFIREHKDKLNIGIIMYHNKLTEELIEELVCDGLISTDDCIYALNTTQNLSEKFIDKYINSGIIKLNLLCHNPNIPLEVIDKYSSHIDINWISLTITINKDPDKYINSPIFNEFISKHRDKLLLDVLLNNPKIIKKSIIDNYESSPNLMYEYMHAQEIKSIYSDDIDWLDRNIIMEAIVDKGLSFGGWKEMSKTELLHEYMIRKHKDDVDWFNIFRYQPHLSEEFKEEFVDEYGKYKLSISICSDKIPGSEQPIYPYNNTIKFGDED